MEELKVPILGGDILKRSGDDVKMTDEHWFCDRKEKEELDLFCLRSIEYTRQKIEYYKTLLNENILFILVLQI